MRQWVFIFAPLLLFAVTACPAQQGNEDRLLQTRGKSPQASFRCLRVRPGFRVELVAAEPLINDPIAIAWGPDGKLFVVEMGDYPLGSDGGSGGRIRCLEDTNKDGKYDHSAVLLDRLAFPTGVMAWRKGVLVTCAPDIFYAEDTDGDGRADRREVLFRGFVEDNQQHRVNGLRWGLDNWVHCANGDSGGVIRSLKTGQRTDIHGRDFRIRPDQGLLDPQTGMSQFGRCRDDWGNWFGGNAAWPFWHCVLADQYLRRNRYLAPPEPCVQLMFPASGAPVFPISRPLPRFNEPTMTNRITSACGAAVYRDDLFGPEFVNSYFVCEPAHNLVHHQIMHRRGVTFFSTRPAEEQESEFLASSDNWFRPTQVRTGPDGALWVVDMYRLVIEHPDWMPEHWQRKVDLRAGHGQGRIYRVYREDRPPRRIARLDQLDLSRLVAAMDSPNGPQRDMVQRLLVHRGDRAAVALLEQLLASSRRAACRLSALCTLEGLDAIRPEVLQKALHDSHPAVRRHAIRIGEPLLNKAPQLQAAVIQHVQDADPQVRLQLAYSLGQWNHPGAVQALAQLAVNDVEDPYVLAAVMSSATRFPDRLLAAVIRHGGRSPAHAALIENLLTSALVTDQGVFASGLKKVAETVDQADAQWQFDVVAGLLDALQSRGTSLGQLHQEADAELKSAIESLAAVFETARAIATDRRQPVPRRVRAVRLLGRGCDKQDADLQDLARLLAPQAPGQLQQAALSALGKLHRDDVPQLLLKDWRRHGPQLRTRILDTLLGRTEWTKYLLDRIESQHVSPAMIGTDHRHRLILHYYADVRRRASDLLSTPLRADRQQVIQRYRDGLDLTGDPQRGEVIFRQHCAACHNLTEGGQEVGPDLRALTDRSPETLLVAVLDPNRAVEPRYVDYCAITGDGRVFSGILVSETGNSITLLGPGAKRQVLLRADLQHLASTGKSLMPEGLEQLIPESQDLADLLAFVGGDHLPMEPSSHGQGPEGAPGTTP